MTASKRTLYEVVEIEVNKPLLCFLWRRRYSGVLTRPAKDNAKQSYI
jgi:hypothetical protein